MVTFAMLPVWAKAKRASAASEVREEGEGAPGLDVGQVRDLLRVVTSSEICRAKDLRDPVILLAASGLRRSELLALRWDDDVDMEKRTLTVSGSVVRLKGQGLVRQDTTKTGEHRVVALLAVTAWLGPGWTAGNGSTWWSRLCLCDGLLAPSSRHSASVVSM